MAFARLRLLLLDLKHGFLSISVDFIGFHHDFIGFHHGFVVVSSCFHHISHFEVASHVMAIAALVRSMLQMPAQARNSL